MNNWISTYKKMDLDPYFLPKKNELKRIVDLNLNVKL
jgi:hypothetical protein